MFSNKVQLMLYVDDVVKARDFWLSLDFTLVEEQEMDGTLVVEVALAGENQIHFVIYDREFIERHSPEVATNSPSLMFFSDDVFGLYKKVQEQEVTVGEMVQLGEQLIFNFSDTDGHFFAVTGKEKE